MKTNEKFITEVYALVGDKYTPLEKYAGANKKIKFIHHECGTVYLVTPHHFLCDKSRCPHCFGTPKRSKVGYQQLLDKKFNKRYTLLEPYIDTDTLMVHRCNKCGHEWKIRPHNLLRGYGCPACNASSGEKLVYSILVNAHVDFIFQKKFADLKDVSYLSYDFL